jgi:hypothetical protein
MEDREQQIREIAYRIWEDEGRPSDQADRHWQIAELQVAEEDAKARWSDAARAPRA